MLASARSTLSRPDDFDFLPCTGCGNWAHHLFSLEKKQRISYVITGQQFFAVRQSVLATWRQRRSRVIKSLIETTTRRAKWITRATPFRRRVTRLYKIPKHVQRCRCVASSERENKLPRKLSKIICGPRRGKQSTVCVKQFAGTRRKNERE